MERLREWLNETGTTQAALAEALGLRQPSIAGWLSGDTYPTGKTLIELVKHTGLSADELLGITRRSTKKTKAA